MYTSHTSVKGGVKRFCQWTAEEEHRSSFLWLRGGSSVVERSEVLAGQKAGRLNVPYRLEVRPALQPKFFALP